MKKLLILTLICLMVFSLVACKSVGDIVGEKIMDELTDESGGEFKMDDGTIRYEGESGEEVNIGGNQWPTDMIAKYLPKLNAGEVAGTYNSDNSCMVTVENVEKGQFEDYLNGIKKDGYTDNPLDITQGESIHYYAENGEFGIQLIYDGETKEASISITRMDF